MSDMEKYEFDAAAAKDKCIEWIRKWFEENGPGCKAVIGISGGKDSTVVAALCTAALGRERVFGVLMPQGEQADINDSYRLVKGLNIPYAVCNIASAVEAVKKSVEGSNIELSSQTVINLPPRIRMATVYAVSQSVNGRVANTCNLSEDWVGYSTRYGDSAGDFSPLGNFTVGEVKAIGRLLSKELGFPADLIDKVPSDGLCGKTDEDNLGFTYDVLDKYIRSGICGDENVKEKIDSLHAKNLFKLKTIPVYEPQ